jgi:hypothetical protein
VQAALQDKWAATERPIVKLVSVVGTGLYVLYDNAQWMAGKKMLTTTMNGMRPQYKMNAGFYWLFGLMASIMLEWMAIKKAKNSDSMDESAKERAIRVARFTLAMHLGNSFLAMKNWQPDSMTEGVQSMGGLLGAIAGLSVTFA